MVKLNAKNYFTAAVVILLLVFFHYSQVLAPVENFFSRGLKPLAGGFYALSSKFNRTMSDQTAKVDWSAKLQAANEQIARLTAENVRLKFLENENALLRKNLNFLSARGGRFLMASVISRGDLSGGAEDGQVLVIDKGARDGLYAGLPVVSSAVYATSTSGVIIGKVMNVKEQIAEVYLVTDKNCRLAAAILGESQTAGVVNGELGLTVKMDFIPQTKNIKVGDAVATSGLEKNIPRGLVIGLVKSVNKENNDVWQSAVIEPLANLEALSAVAVLLP